MAEATIRANQDRSGEPRLPSGWIWATLGDLAAINRRDPTARDLPDDMDVSFVPMAAVDADSGRIVRQDVRTLSQVRKGFTSFADGDVLFAKITPCMENGKAAIAHGLTNGRGYGSTEFHVLTPLEGVLPQWLFYFVRQQSFRDEAQAHFAGTAGQLRVPAGFLASHPIPLAPTDEQRRIVGAIETQFTRLDAGVVGLKRVQAKLKRYRAAVLKAAVEGTLTAAWRAQHPDVEPASLLLQRILQERRSSWEVETVEAGKASGKSGRPKYKPPSPASSFGAVRLPKSWCETSVGQITECLDYARVPINRTLRANRTGNIPYYGANGQVGCIDTYLFDEPLVLVVEDETFTGREKPFSYHISGKTWVNNHAHVLRSTGAVIRGR